MFKDIYETAQNDVNEENKENENDFNENSIDDTVIHNSINNSYNIIDSDNGDNQYNNFHNFSKEYNNENEYDVKQDNEPDKNEYDKNKEYDIEDTQLITENNDNKNNVQKTKSKKKITLNDINDTISDINTSLQSAFDDFLDSKIETDSLDKLETISTGLDVLDAILGGGIPLGNFCVFVGNPGSGKSTLAVRPLVKLQEKYGSKCLCLYLDSEETMSTKRLEELGVISPKLKPKSNITIEKLFEIIEGIILFKEEKNIVDYPVLIIWDSIANTITNKDLISKDINETIGLKARILSTMLPKYITKLRKYNITLLAINQLREKLHMGLFQQAPDLKYLGQERDMPGGQAIKFNAAQLINIKHKTDLKKDQYGFDGIKVNVKTVKNKVTLPNQECDIVLNFKTGFDNFWTNYIFLTDKKYIRAGAWNKLDNYVEKSFRTNEAKNLYETDEKFKNCFDELVKQCIDKEIIEKK